MKTFLLLLLAFPGFVSAGTNYWTLENCSGLQREQLSLTIDSKKVGITEFFEVPAGQKQPGVIHPAIRRKLIVLMDVEFLSLDELIRAKDLAAKMLQKAGTNDLVSVATLSRKGLQYLSMLSTDRESGISALKSIEKKSESEKKSADPRGGLVTGFAELALQLSVIQGPKIILLFSPGFNTDGLRSQAPSDEDPPELVMGDVSEEERLEWQKQRTDKKEIGIQYDFSKIPELLAGSGTSVNLISQSENDFYRSLVAKTDGMQIKDNVEAGMDLLLGLDSSFCIIGWNASPEKEFKHTLNLRVQSGTKTIIESPWIAPRSLVSLSSGERKLKASEALYSDYESAEPFEFLADSIIQEGERRIPVFVEVPGDYILKNGSSQALLEFYVFATDQNGSMVDSFFLPVQLDLKNKKLKERIVRSGLKMWNVLSGGNETVNVRWVVMDLTSDRVITHSETVESHAQSLTLSRPFFPDLNLDWVLWPAPDFVIQREGKQIRYPYTAGSDYFFPDLSPKLLTSESAVLYMRIYNKPPASKNPAISMKVSDETGKIASIDQFQLFQKPVTLEHNGLELFWKIASFPLSRQGSYSLKVEIQDLSSGRAISREIPLLLQ